MSYLDIMTTSFYDIYMQEKSLQYRHIFSPDVDDSNELDQFEDDTEATGGILLKLNLKGDITPVHIMKVSLEPVFLNYESHKTASNRG